MADVRLQSRADELAARVQALARALHASGVSDEASERLLARASAAALQALTLELLLVQREPASSAAQAEEPRCEPSLPLAA
jgi:hypothetical protein